MATIRESIENLGKEFVNVMGRIADAVPAEREAYRGALLDLSKAANDLLVDERRIPWTEFRYNLMSKLKRANEILSGIEVPAKEEEVNSAIAGLRGRTFTKSQADRLHDIINCATVPEDK